MGNRLDRIKAFAHNRGSRVTCSVTFFDTTRRLDTDDGRVETDQYWYIEVHEGNTYAYASGASWDDVLDKIEAKLQGEFGYIAA